MEPSRIKIAEEVFQQALDLPAPERLAYVARACNGDTKLQGFVAEMLRTADTQGPMDTPVFANPPALGKAGAIPARIGEYEVLSVIGEGGMAVVYAARQENPSRVVALKVMKTGVMSREALRRFNHEIQVLGRLQHPGIAHIYGAAVAEFVTPGGLRINQPYFAMELVRGLPLTTYAREHNLTTEQRLELLARVCDAVQYAHQNGVIHRDLKPANVIVEDEDSRGAASPGQKNGDSSAVFAAHLPRVSQPHASSQPPTATSVVPKVLDFGVARVIGGADAANPTMNTEAGRVIGTLAYMSPEQLSGEVEQTDTRSDVYSLGVMMYELLAGRLPHQIDGTALPEAARRIREDQPTRLGQFDRRLRGDIETIAARAMEKDRTRRYTSAADLAEDLRMLLRGEAIEARRDSAMYVFRKGLHRNRGWVAAGLGIFAGVAAFAAYAWSQAERFERLSASEHTARVDAENSQRSAAENEQKAQKEAANAKIVSEFLKGVIKLANPDPSKGYQMTLTDLLDSASKRLEDGELKDNAPVEAEIRETLVDTYGNLDLSAAAVPHMEWLLEYRRKTFGEGSEKWWSTLVDLGGYCVESGQLVKAEPLLRQAVDFARQRYGADAKQTDDTKILLGNCLMRGQRNAEALEYTRDAVESVTRREGEQSPETAFARYQLAGVYRNLRQIKEAEAMYLLAIPVFDAKQPSYISTIRCRWSYARDCLLNLGKYPEAEKFLSQTVEMATKYLGAEHAETLAVKRHLANAYFHLGRTDEALEMIRSSLEICQNTRKWIVTGETQIILELVAELKALKRWDEAEAQYATCIERFERLRGRLDIQTLNVLEVGAGIARDRGQKDVALSRYQELTARSVQLNGGNDARTVRWRKQADTLAKQISQGAAMQPGSEKGPTQTEAADSDKSGPGKADPGKPDPSIRPK